MRLLLQLVSESCGDGFRAAEVMLYEQPAHPHFDIGHNTGSVVPVASESFEFMDPLVNAD